MLQQRRHSFSGYSSFYYDEEARRHAEKLILAQDDENIYDDLDEKEDGSRDSQEHLGYSREGEKPVPQRSQSFSEIVLATSLAEYHLEEQKQKQNLFKQLIDGQNELTKENWHFHCDEQLKEDLKKDFVVFFVSLATKFYGRWVMIEHIEQSGGFNLSQYLWLNFIWAIPEIMAISMVARFFFDIANIAWSAREASRENQTSFSEEFNKRFSWKTQGANMVETGFKFGTVYTTWSVAMGLLKAVGFLGMGAALWQVVLGVIVLAVVTSLAFMLATWIANKVKGKETKKMSAATRGAAEGFIWTAVEAAEPCNTVGEAVDIMSVMAGVSGGFVGGGLMYSFYRVFRNNRKREKTYLCEEKRNDLEKLVEDLALDADKTVEDKCTAIANFIVESFSQGYFLDSNNQSIAFDDPDAIYHARYVYNKAIKMLKFKMLAIYLDQSADVQDNFISTTPGKMKSTVEEVIDIPRKKDRYAFTMTSETRTRHQFFNKINHDNLGGNHDLRVQVGVEYNDALGCIKHPDEPGGRPSDTDLFSEDSFSSVVSRENSLSH
ncbi:MAG: hypothetical protein ACE365_04235 [Gammaproteobacteria bacterium]